MNTKVFQEAEALAARRQIEFQDLARRVAGGDSPTAEKIERIYVR